MNDAHTPQHGLPLLLQIVQQLSLARRLDDVMAVVRRGARELTGSDGATFILRDGDLCYYADEDAIEPLWKGLRFPMSRCVSGWAMLNRCSAVIPDIYQDDRVPIDAYRPTFVKSMVMVPIRTQAPIGAIGCYWAHPHAASTDEVALIQALADTTSVAIENVQLLDGLERRVQERTIALQQANEELEAFSVSVSHDLRAPLRAIDGYARLLAEHSAGGLDDEANRFVQTIRSSADRMGAIIDDLMMLSRVGRSDMAVQPVDLATRARDVLATLAAAEPQRTVQWRVADRLPVRGDPRLLQIALENLLGNAWKYTGQRADATIEVLPFQAEGEAGVCVRDNGVGFDMARAGRLFEPFRRMHTDAEFHGTGIGLAIVKRVVQRHGGRVWAEAQKGQGASFFVALPAQDQLR